VSATSPGDAVLLLVEDNPGDATLFTELLSESPVDRYRLLHVETLGEAVEMLRTRSLDVVVLDLELRDSSGIDGVRVIREYRRQIPIVVLTGTDDERLALSCIEAGAQDYLAKNAVRAQDLKRALGYAISRTREGQLRDLQETLDRYRGLSSATQRTTVTAALAGSGAISHQSPAAFDDVVREYAQLLEPYLNQPAERLEIARPAMERVITAIGDANGGPRDLLDAHLAALQRATAGNGTPHARTLVFESRLLALEMMGLLVDYYRVGHRRRLG